MIFEDGPADKVFTVKVFHSAGCKFFSIFSSKATMNIASRCASPDFLADCPGDFFRVSGDLSLVLALNHYACQWLGS